MTKPSRAVPDAPDYTGCARFFPNEGRCRMAVYQRWDKQRRGIDPDGWEDKLWGAVVLAWIVLGPLLLGGLLIWFLASDF